MILLQRQTDKINRQVQFMYAPIFDPEEILGKNNRWLYDRAPEGYKFILDSIQVSTSTEQDNRGAIFTIYDGHEYTHWNIYPGVESKEILFRCEFNQYQLNHESNLHNWECKEYTLACRSHSTIAPIKLCIIIWYYLRKMSWLEKLQYAVMQPRGQRYRKGGPTTVERDEELGT